MISFQQLDFEIDMIFEIWELISEQERLSNKKSTDRVCKILDRSDINTSRHFLKCWAAEGNTVDHEKEKQTVFRSAWGNKKMIKWWISEAEDNGVERNIIRWMSTGGKSMAD